MELRRGLMMAMAGAGSNVETGTFVADTSDSLTISVTKPHTKLYIWHPTITKDTDLSDAPYGTYKRIGLFVDNDLGFIYQGMIGSTGKAFAGSCEKTGNVSTDSNYVTFSSSSISISKLRYAGGNRTFIDGATYNWMAL